ncbi:hypothetical protein AB0C98_10980 [Streptomyces sp. NPDC048558]|uniref:hypothetical protein n=1 Tax=Streptomyces sp. NPDC048558 TaxID=3155759 RepID=UPI0034037AC6
MDRMPGLGTPGHRQLLSHDASGNQVTTAKDGTITSRTQWDPNAPLPISATEYDSAWAIKHSDRYDPLGQPAARRPGPAPPSTTTTTPRAPVDVASSSGTLHSGGPTTRSAPAC